jgi:hypothetical protein
LNLQDGLIVELGEGHEPENLIHHQHLMDVGLIRMAETAESHRPRGFWNA